MKIILSNERKIIISSCIRIISMKQTVLNVEPTADYKLLLTFKGGKKRIFDFMPLLDDKINEPLKDINFFMTAKVHHHTVMWNEKLDISPEYLYEKSVKVK